MLDCWRNHLQCSPDGHECINVSEQSFGRRWHNKWPDGKRLCAVADFVRSAVSQDQRQQAEVAAPTMTAASRMLQKGSELTYGLPVKGKVVWLPLLGDIAPPRTICLFSEGGSKWSQHLKLLTATVLRLIDMQQELNHNPPCLSVHLGLSNILRVSHV